MAENPRVSELRVSEDWRGVEEEGEGTIWGAMRRAQEPRLQLAAGAEYKMATAFREACKHGTRPSCRARINIIGHSGAGKTSLTRRLLGQEFQENEESTDGIETHRIEVDLQEIEEQSQKWVETELKPDDLAKIFSEDVLERRERGAEHFQASYFHWNNPSSQVNAVSPDVIKELLKEEQKRARQVHQRIAHKLKPKKRQDHRKRLKKLAAPKHRGSLGSAQKDGSGKTNGILKLWDFGGQTEFYTTHHIFLDADAINIIVMDISKPLKETLSDQLENNVRPITCAQKLGREKDQMTLVGVPQTPEEFLCYWLRSIQVKADEKNLTPIVMLVLTHKSTVSGLQPSSYVNSFVVSVLKALRENNLPPIDEKHIHIVDNHTGDQREFDKIKLHVVTLLQEKLQWASVRPVKWLKLEADLRAVLDSKTEKPCKYLTYAEVKQLSEKLLMDQEELEGFLSFMHTQGDVIWFPDEVLREVITLDPQWLVDMFKVLITSEQFVYRRSLRDEALELLQHGTVTFSALQKFWAGNDAVFLIKLMQNFDLMCPLQKEKAEAAAHTGKYLVPSMLPQTEVEHPKELFENMVLVYMSEHQAAFHQLFPIGTAAKLFCVFSKRWQLREDHLSHRFDFSSCVNMELWLLSVHCSLNSTDQLQACQLL